MTSWLESQFSLTGKKALVTGSSKGIGASIAQALAQAGADIVLVGRTKDSLEATKSAIINIGRKVEIILCDVSSADAIKEAFSDIAALKVDILINNAGSISRAPAAEAQMEEWNRIIETNLNSVFQISQACGRAMIAQGAGTCVGQRRSGVSRRPARSHGQ